MDFNQLLIESVAGFREDFYVSGNGEKVFLIM